MFAVVLGMVLVTPVDAAASRPAFDPSNQPPAEMWIGHQVVWGTANVPLVGQRQTRTDSYFLTQVVHTAEGMRLRQQTCRVHMAPVAGVHTRLPSHVVPRLPPVEFSLTAEKDGHYKGRWLHGWTPADHDGDGKPGVSVHVDVPLCSGRVYVTTESDTAAHATFVGDSLQGEVVVRYAQNVLGASNPCLRFGPNHLEDTLQGVFRYQPVSADSTCESIASTRWPLID